MIFFGYICGIVTKLTADSFKWYVLFFYCLNLTMVGLDICLYFRNKAEAAGLTVCRDYPLSNMLTPLLTGSADAHELFLQLSRQFGFYVNPCRGERAHSMLRISHAGHLTDADSDALIAAILTLTH